ncbi:hypothetical protein TNCV_5114341 [Trichonephila clavipes]|nr:hypothetical protein TNCV_5114341 [Trichonephila clavipes]
MTGIPLTCPPKILGQILCTRHLSTSKLDFDSTFRIIHRPDVDAGHSITRKALYDAGKKRWLSLEVVHKEVAPI